MSWDLRNRGDIANGVHSVDRDENPVSDLGKAAARRAGAAAGGAESATPPPTPITKLVFSISEAEFGTGASRVSGMC